MNKAMGSKKGLSSTEHQELLSTLKVRFEKNMQRHNGIEWPKLHAKLTAAPEKMLALYKMECTGGEPDVISQLKAADDYVFYDCSAGSPSDRRSLCYDQAGLESRKEHPPENSAIEMAAEMGIELLNEEQYRFLQQFGNFDLKTSSWILTPPPIRRLGGALFADFRYGQPFVYHNGPQSYYAARGFRGSLHV